jgi:hypothetical protein
MGDGERTGTVAYKGEKPSPERLLEIKTIFELLNKHLRGRCQADLYKDQADFVIEACMARIPYILHDACCVDHAPMDLWTDGFLIGLMTAALGVIRVEIKADA